MSGFSYSGYAVMLAGAIAITVPFWIRLARRDRRLMFIYLVAILGAFLGANFVYLAAEGWRQHGLETFSAHLVVGKSVLGGLLGGYLAVELAKRVVRYRQPTGDLFATVLPLALILGRFGCLQAGCCLGVACNPAWFTLADEYGVQRWPAVPLEILFNLVCVLVFYTLRKGSVLRGQHFHLYLIGYGLFRMCHEFARDTPEIIGGISGYQIAAVLVAVLGIWGFNRRRRQLQRNLGQDGSIF